MTPASPIRYFTAVGTTNVVVSKFAKVSISVSGRTSRPNISVQSDASVRRCRNSCRARYRDDANSGIGTRAMNARKKRRLAFAAALVAVGAMVAGVIVYGLGENPMYFRSPTDVAGNMVHPGVAFRIGGLVEKGSLLHGDGAQVRFRVTDGRS